MSDESEIQALRAEMAAILAERDAIYLMKDVDGNWRGFMQKNGKLIEERQINPEYTLQALLTNDGTK